MTWCDTRDPAHVERLLREEGWSLEIRWGNRSASQHWLVKDGERSLRAHQSATRWVHVWDGSWVGLRDDERKVTIWRSAMGPETERIPRRRTNESYR